MRYKNSKAIARMREAGRMVAECFAILEENIQPGVFDMITHINGRRTRTLTDVRQVLEGVQRGDVLSLRVTRVAGEDGGVQSRVVRYRAGGER